MVRALAAAGAHVVINYHSSGDDANALQRELQQQGRKASTWRADISRDGGKTWIENHRALEARRIGPARPPAALTPPAGRKTVGEPR